MRRHPTAPSAPVPQSKLVHGRRARRLLTLVACHLTLLVLVARLLPLSKAVASVLVIASIAIHALCAVFVCCRDIFQFERRSFLSSCLIICGILVYLHLLVS